MTFYSGRIQRKTSPGKRSLWDVWGSQLQASQVLSQWNPRITKDLLNSPDKFWHVANQRLLPTFRTARPGCLLGADYIGTLYLAPQGKLMLSINRVACTVQAQWDSLTACGGGGPSWNPSSQMLANSQPCEQVFPRRAGRPHSSAQPPSTGLTRSWNYWN